MSDSTTADSTIPIAVLDSLDFVVTSVDLEGTILFLNTPAAKNLSGTRESIVGKNLYDYFPERAAATRERIRQTVENRSVQHFEAVVNLPDGREKYFDSAYHPQFDSSGEVVAVQIVAMDVTELRQRQEERSSSLWDLATDDLSMTSERLTAVLQSLPINVAIHEATPAMTIRYMNWGPQGVDLADVIGSSPLAWLTDRGQATISDALQRVMNGVEHTKQRVRRGASGYRDSYP
jgi:PAS domain S-box-containing protein